MMLTTRQSQRPLASILWQSARFYASKKTASSNKWLNRQNNDQYTRAAKFQDYKSRAAFKLLQIDEKFKLFSANQRVVDLGFAPGAWTQVAVEKTAPEGQVLGVDIIPAVPPKGASALQANILSKRTHVLIQQFFLRRQRTEEENQMQSYIDYEHQVSEEVGVIDDPQQYEKELNDDQRWPVDLILSDMYAPVIPPERYWNNTTNSAFHRMLNTSGVAVKDHSGSIDLCDAALILAIDILKPGGSFTCKFYTGNLDKGLEERLKKVFNRVTRFKPEACRPESKECYFVATGKRKNLDKVDVFS